MSEKLKSCPFCGSDELMGGESLSSRIECLNCLADGPWASDKVQWNHRPGEATARLTAFEEGKQWTIAFIQSHFYDRPDEIECLEKDVANVFQILKEKP